MALLEGGKEELRPILTLEQLKCCSKAIGRGRLPSVGQSSHRQRFKVSLTSCQHYGLTPPVAFAGRDSEGMASAVRRRVTTQHLRVALRALSVPVLLVLSLLIKALSFYGYPSRELNHHCALSSLSPTTHTMGGNRLLIRGNVLERLPELGLNC